MKIIVKANIEIDNNQHIEQTIVYEKKMLKGGDISGDDLFCKKIKEALQVKNEITIGGTMYLKRDLNNPLAMLEIIREAVGHNNIIDIKIIGRLKTIPNKNGRIY